MRISDWSSDVCSSDLDNQPVPQIRHALSVRRSDDFAAWYQAVIAEADMAEESGVRGCMVIKPWGYRSEERRVGKDVSVRVDLGGRRIIKTKPPPQPPTRQTHLSQTPLAPPYTI